METYKKATPTQYEEFLNLMLEHMADYVETLMEQMDMSIEEFRHLLTTVGQVYRINSGQEVAGFYWVEERGEEIHLHGIVLKENHQGRRIGTRVLNEITKKYQGKKAFIELGVHQDNKRAIKYYEESGYQIAEVKEALGFYIMRKNLSDHAYIISPISRKFCMK
jgi:ribosomal protein S18 acetylase RimI-like enzyme